MMNVKDHKIVGFTLGFLLTMLGIAELIPALFEWIHNGEEAGNFFLNAFFSLFFGIISCLGQPLLRQKSHRTPSLYAHHNELDIPQHICSLPALYITAKTQLHRRLFRIHVRHYHHRLNGSLWSGQHERRNIALALNNPVDRRHRTSRFCDYPAACFARWGNAALPDGILGHLREIPPA